MQAEDIRRLMGTKKSAVTAVTFALNEHGTLLLTAIVVQDGAELQQLINVAKDALDMIAKGIEAHHRDVLREHNPGRIEA